MISKRFTLPVIGLLVFALVPTVIHSYLQAREDDGRSANDIPTTLSGYSSNPYERHSDAWVLEMFNSKDWIERIYGQTKKKEMRLFVARSYDHKSLYHHPELGLSHGKDLVSRGVVTIPGEPEVKAHLLTGSNGVGVVAYALLYDGKFIEDPIRHQLGESMLLVVNPKRAMTMFYIDASGVKAADDFAQTDAAMLLRDAVISFISSEKISASK